MLSSEIAKEIQEDLGQVAKQLKDELIGDHPLLSSEHLEIVGTIHELPLQMEIEESLILTPLLLVSAKMNRYDFSKLKPTALALELLNSAVRKHYQPDIRHQTSDNNLALIVGDYYYAKALCLVAQLKDSRVIEILSQAVAFIAEGMAEESGQVDSLQKKASLYAAACHLGAYLSESDSETIGLLKSYGENFGIAHQMILNGQESEQAKNFFEAARQALLFLPKSPSRSYLTDLLEDRR